MTDTKILVSDDEEIWRERTLARLLREAGHNVATAADIRDTLRKISREFYHVVIADICFSKEDHTNIDGVKTVQAVADWDEGTRAIVLTGFGTVDLAVQALREFNVYHFLQKGKGFEQDPFTQLVNRAAAEAEVALTSSRLTIRPAIITGDIPLHDLSSKLGVKEASLLWIIKNLLNQAHPVLIGSKRCDITKGSKGYVLSRMLWGRMQGRPLRLLVGNEAEMSLRLAAASNCVAKAVLDNAVGLLLEESAVDFQDFDKFLGAKAT